MIQKFLKKKVINQAKEIKPKILNHQKKIKRKKERKFEKQI